jgi:hypothetical protein
LTLKRRSKQIKFQAAIEKQGGVLQYQTRPGHGTTFGVVLPREPDHIAERARSDAIRKP